MKNRQRYYDTVVGIYVVDVKRDISLIHDMAHTGTLYFHSVKQQMRYKFNYFRFQQNSAVILYLEPQNSLACEPNPALS